MEPRSWSTALAEYHVTDPNMVRQTLADFSDAGVIAVWAKEAMAYLVEAGIISVSNGKLMPNNTTTRAEMAQVLHNLLSKKPYTSTFHKVRIP